ncbi:hypothetical protein AURDEDRAFT_173519 [Auricularia subglabra TFB-10046 SS5]|nr:hypothetical protein AURDEDRAFT_173519 [Auricularia subglabra TFB-10046 SS5]
MSPPLCEASPMMQGARDVVDLKAPLLVHDRPTTALGKSDQQQQALSALLWPTAYERTGTCAESLGGVHVSLRDVLRDDLHSQRDGESETESLAAISIYGTPTHWLGSRLPRLTRSSRVPIPPEWHDSFPSTRPPGSAMICCSHCEAFPPISGSFLRRTCGSCEVLFVDLSTAAAQCQPCPALPAGGESNGVCSRIAGQAARGETGQAATDTDSPPPFQLPPTRYAARTAAKTSADPSHLISDDHGGSRRFAPLRHRAMHRPPPPLATLRSPSPSAAILVVAPLVVLELLS